MIRKQKPFWKTKPLDKLSPEEWESICDGCGVCCLQKIVDEETGKARFTAVTCEFLDTVTCRCLVYENRASVKRDCIVLSPGNIRQITWLPETCAYRCLVEGKTLEAWHPLITRDRNTVHRAGVSVRDKVVPGKFVHPEEDLTG